MTTIRTITSRFHGWVVPKKMYDLVVSLETEPRSWMTRRLPNDSLGIRRQRQIQLQHGPCDAECNPVSREDSELNISNITYYVGLCWITCWISCWIFVPCYNCLFKNLRSLKKAPLNKHSCEIWPTWFDDLPRNPALVPSLQRVLEMVILGVPLALGTSKKPNV